MARGERVKGRTWVRSQVHTFYIFWTPYLDPSYLNTQRPSYVLRSHHQIYLQSDPMHQDCIHMVHPLKIATQNPTQDSWANKLGLGIFRHHTPKLLLTIRPISLNFLFSFYLLFFQFIILITFTIKNHIF